MTKKLSFLIGLFFSLAALVDAADTYKPDPAHTTVGFTATHLVITKVHGKFKQFDATVVYDENDVTKSSMNGTIKAATIDTGNENRDEHLRSEDFFNAQKYPEITFQSKKIEKAADGYKMYGTLTMRGVSKEIAFPFSITGPVQAFGATKLGVEARMKLNRKDFGVSWSKLLEGGGAVVGDQVEISIDSELVKQN